jgi:hypothetical protein
MEKRPRNAARENACQQPHPTLTEGSKREREREVFTGRKYSRLTVSTDAQRGREVARRG